ncbi:MAG: tetratricopeptide repeat protein, partial [Proteobacteria bacterium]|nr:tetratricopeptide repeat protein [Pseudomonadota bacterium]
FEVARLYDDDLADFERAEKAYRGLLDLDRENPETALPAITALERLLSANEAWEQVIDILRKKVALTDDLSERKAILRQMAELEESVLQRAPNAVALFREILDNDDSDMDALLGLERLYERGNMWPDLIEVLKQRVIMEGAEDVRRGLLLRIAALYENQLGDLDEAIASYVQVGEETGSNATAVDALARLYNETERWGDLLEIYETKERLAQSDEERAAFLFKMGDLLRDKLDDQEQAVSRLGEVLRIEVSHTDARNALEMMLTTPFRLEAVHILRPIYESETNHEKRITCDEIEAEEVDDPLAKCDLLRHAAEVAEVGLEQHDRAFHFIGKAFREGTAAPDLTLIIDHLERLANIVERNEELIGLFREVAPDILDGDLQVRCNLRMAQIAHLDLDDLDLAREYYVKVLDIDGENAMAMDALEDIYENRQQYLELFEIYRRKSQIVSDEEARRDILFKQARVCEEYLDDISGATSIYETVLDYDFVNRKAMEALERLYPRSERWSDLMSLLERRAEVDEGERADHLHRLGKLAEEKLDDYEQALEYYARALEIDSAHGETLMALETQTDDETFRGRVAEILGPVYKATGDWTKLVAALDAQLEYCDDPVERKELLRQIGILYEEQLGDLESACDTFARLFKEDLEDKTSWDVLTRLVSVLELWSELAQVYEDALDDVVGDTPTTAELSFVLGEIYEQRLNRPAEATQAYRRTLAFAPDDPNAFSAVERMLLETESWVDLLDLYRDAADAAVETDRRKDFLFKIGEIYKLVNEDLDAAIGAYRDALDIDMYDEFAITSLDTLYERAGRFEDLTMHIRTQIDNAEDPVARNALRCRLGKIYQQNLKDLSASVDAYEEALHEEEGGTTTALSALEHVILEEEQRQRIAEILEPLYRQSDEWKKLIVILRVQVEYVENPNEKAEKFREISEIHESRGQNFLLAFESMAKTFRANPSDRDVLSEMVRLAEGTENWDELVQVLGDTLEEIYDYDMKIDVLHLLGSTYDHHLDMPRKAIGAYQSILEINDSDITALDALEGLFNLIGDWEGLVGVLSLKVNFVMEPSDRAELLRTKASIQEDLMSVPDEAIDSYRQALETDPTSETTLDALERLYEHAKEWFELIEIKRQRVNIMMDEEARFEVLRSIARVYEEQVDDAIEAIGAWNAVLDQSPQDVSSVKALENLYQSESMFTELLDTLQLQKEMVVDQAMVVDIDFRIGELQEHQLSDSESAIDSYRDVLLNQPTHTGAIEALERIAKDESFRARAIEVIEPLHREAGRWDRLVDMLELKIEMLDDPGQRLEELLIVAEVHQVGRSDPHAAFGVYDRALEAEPSRAETLASLERIAGAEALWDELTQVYEKQLEKVYDAEVEWALLARLGEVKETHRGDIRGAIDAYRRALDSGSTDPNLLFALDRLYLGEAMWQDLDEILEREIELAESSDEANRYKLRQGEIREHEFDDVPGAIAVFRDVVENSPENNEAIAALQTLLDRDAFVEDIVEVLTSVFEMRDEQEMIGELFAHRLRVAETDGEKAQLYRELAVHQEEVVGDLSAAFDAYSKAFVIDSTEQKLLEDLERLAAALGAWAALVETSLVVLESQGSDSSSSVDLGLRVAEWARTKVGDFVRAEALYRAVLESEPEHDQALAALEELLKSQGKFEDLLPITQQRAEATYDFSDKKELYMSIAAIARVELGDSQRAMAAYQAVRELDEADLDALDALIELNDELGENRSLVESLLSRADFTALADEANQFRHRAAEICMDLLDDMSRAMEVYRDVLDNDPADSNAGSRLESLYEKLERWTDLSDLLMQRLDMAEADADRVAVFKHLAELQEKHFEDLDGAIGHLNEVLMIAPDDAETPDNLERLYIRTERWQDLVEMLENQADRARSSERNDEELGLLTRIGLIWDQRLEDPDRATAIYERVLETDPEHTGALAALARLYEAAADWERCAEILNRAAAVGRGGPDDAEVHFRLARLHQAQMDDEEKAAEELRIAVTIDPRHVEANAALVEYCREKGDSQGLLEALMREEKQLDDREQKVSRLLEIAELQFGPIADGEGAVASLEKAQELVPDNKNVLLKLSDAYVEGGRQDEAIPVIESLIDAETDGGKKRSRKAAVYHQRLAKAHLARGDQDKGMEHLEAAYKLDISNIDVLISLGQLTYQREEYDKAAKLFRALLLQRFDAVTVGVSKADIYWYVGDISLKQGDQRKAKGMFQRGLDEERGHEKCKAGLAECS